MFQMAVELAPKAHGYGLSLAEISGNHTAVSEAMLSLNADTFWGRLKLNHKGWNEGFQMGARIKSQCAAGMQPIEYSG